MWSLENVWRIVVVAASATAAAAAAIASFKRKTRMNNWIRCKHFYSVQNYRRLGTSFKLIG